MKVRLAADMENSKGIALALRRKIEEQHAGRIWPNPAGIGGGTTILYPPARAGI